MELKSKVLKLRESIVLDKLIDNMEDDDIREVVKIYSDTKGVTVQGLLENQLEDFSDEEMNYFSHKNVKGLRQIIEDRAKHHNPNKLSFSDAQEKDESHILRKNKGLKP